MQTLVLALLFWAAPGAPKSDADVEAEIRARLARSRIAADGFQVKVRNGTATWTGKTSIIQRKGAATRMAKSAGARAVDNRIEISEGAKARAAAALQKKPPTAPRTEQTRPEETSVPPPVRRAVIKKASP